MVRKAMLGFVGLSLLFGALPLGLSKSATPISASTPAPVAEKTVLLYLCGSNLEGGSGLATKNLKQVLSAHFGADEKVRCIAFTGGCSRWYTESEYLYDPTTGEAPESISRQYNQVWEVRGMDAPTNLGKRVLLDRDGVKGDGDGKVSYADYIVKDIYDSEIPVNELVDEEAPYLTEISLATVHHSTYDGTKKRPIVTYGEKTLEEGIDYYWEPLNEGDQMIDPGIHQIVLRGVGEFTGKAIMEFEILEGAVEKSMTVQEASQGVEVAELFASAKKEGQEVIFDVGGATFAFDREAVSSISGESILFSFKTVSPANETLGAELAFEVTLTGANWTKGNVNITLGFDKSVPEGKTAKLYYMDPSIGKVEVDATFSGGKVSFTTNHFSTYAIFFVEEAALICPVEGFVFPVWAIVLMNVGPIVVLGVGAFFLIRFIIKKRTFGK